MKTPAIYTRAELADPEPLLPKPRPTDRRQLGLERAMVQLKRAKKPERVDEASLQHAVRLRLGQEPDLLLFRNAQAFGERFDAATGRSTRFSGGLGTGSADLVGLLKPSGRWFSLELKRSSGGRVSPEQRVWIDLVRSFNGFVAVVRSVEEALDALDRARRGETS